ncbi:hypothetical protein GCM10023116_09770 [Kistimonas scapharcae]|uniref:Min27-like integrase DNA-binding domain-containing protein n=1 Tax=Kistimonas scapharcae TaxID=1036133 RepID=A0ABP8V1G8_9GAMM
MGTKQYEGVRSRSKSTIEVGFSYNGKWRWEAIKLDPTPANLKRTARFRARVVQSIEDGTFNYAISFPDSKRKGEIQVCAGGKTNLVLYMRRWLETIKNDIAASTHEFYEKVINQLEDYMPSMPLGGVQGKDMKEWLDSRTRGHKHKNNLLSCVRTALEDAVDAELIAVNPLAAYSGTT